MSRYGLDNGELRFATDDALAANRLVILGADGFPDLAAADSENVIGATRNDVAAATAQPVGVVVSLKTKPGVVLVEVAAEEEITRGSVVFQAAAGMLAATGTVRAGIAMTGGTAGQLVELLPDCGFAFAAPS